MNSIITKFFSMISVTKRYQEVRLHETYSLERIAVRVPVDDCPLRVSFPRLHVQLVIFPEPLLDISAENHNGSFLIAGVDSNEGQLDGFIRITSAGESIVLGSHDNCQVTLLGYPPGMDLRYLKIIHDGDGLIFQPLVYDAEIDLQPMQDDFYQEQIDHRQRCLDSLNKIYGGTIALLQEPECLNAIRSVNEILQDECYRALDDRGKPGGILEIPDEITPIIIGDLHAQVDNLLTLLSQNKFLDMLENGTAALIILGDAVHSEVTGELDKMDSSLLIMDLIFKLKIRFPKQVFYIRGNHDSFSKDVFKAGIAQSMMWEHAVRDRCGETYLEEYKRFYELLPYVVMARDFIACHAAPVRTHFNREMLINIYKNPGLVRELTRNRLRRRNFPAGYHKGDVTHFKKLLGVSEDTQFLVSHSPLNRTDPLWRDAGRIKDHHIVFSANIPWIGVFCRIADRLVPLSFHREPISRLINNMAESGRAVRQGVSD